LNDLFKLKTTTETRRERKRKGEGERRKRVENKTPCFVGGIEKEIALSVLLVE